MTNITYQNMREKSGSFKERNDCAVIAVALVTRSSYEDIHAILKQLGRKDSQGTLFNPTTRQAIHIKGFKLTEVKETFQKNGFRFTPKTIGKKLIRGYYICRSQGHIFAVINGQVLDWTEGGNHRILEIYKITKVRKN